MLAVTGSLRVGGTESRRRGGSFGAGRTARVPGDRGRGLEAAKLGGGVHLRGIAGCHGIWAGAECAGHGATTAVGGLGGLFLVQGEGVDEAAVSGLRCGAEVEDPDDDHHGKQDEACASGLHGWLVSVDQVVCARRC